MQLGDEVEDTEGRKGLILGFVTDRLAWVWLYEERRGRYFPTHSLDVTDECVSEKANEQL